MLPRGGASRLIKKDSLQSCHKLSPKESEESKLPKIEWRIIKKIPNKRVKDKSPKEGPKQKSSESHRKSNALVCLCKKTVVLAKQSLIEKKPPGNTFSSLVKLS